MDRIKLTKDEKILIRALKEGETDTPLLTDGAKYLAARSLERKGLVDVIFCYGKVENIKLSYECKAYLETNPLLRNPIDWRLIEIIFMGVTAIASFLALFVSCSIIVSA